jgi:basic membrane protein A
MRRTLVVSVAVAAAVACLPLAGTAVGSSGASTAKAPWKVALVIAGLSNDGGYWQQNAEGARAAAKKHGAKLSIIENVGFDPQAQINALRTAAREGNKLIIADGTFPAALSTMAGEFPNVQFVANGAPAAKYPPNLHAYVPEQGVTSFIAGVLASKLTKAKKVGYLGGIQDATSGQAGAGFAQGVKHQPPTPALQSTIVGSYTDPLKAKQAASAQIANGADVIYAYLDAGFPGAVRAIQESNKDVLIFSATVMRCTLGDFVVGSAYASNGVILDHIFTDFLGNKLAKGGKFYALQDPGVQKFVLCPKFNNAANRAVVKKMTADINSGKITFPTAVTGIPK